MATLISNSPAETEALGSRWGREATRGLVIGLTGELGAGKTQLVTGIARGLDVATRVHSPTFTLLNEYRGGRLALFHLDLYRLETRAQLLGAGLEDYFFQPDGVAVIEWAEKWFGEMQNAEGGMQNWPGRYRWVWIKQLSEGQRRIVYEDFGA